MAEPPGGDDHVAREARSYGARVRLLAGDITRSVDAIVNAANSALAGGSGVDGATHAVRL